MLIKAMGAWAQLIIVSAALAVGVGCAKDQKVEPPTPPEAKMMAYSVMKFAMTRKEVGATDLQNIETIMLDAKSLLVVTMRENPEQLNTVRMQYLAEQAPEYAALVDMVLGVLVYRLTPLIDQGKTEQAVMYIEAVVDGAVLAIDQAQAG